MIFLGIGKRREEERETDSAPYLGCARSPILTDGRYPEAVSREVIKGSDRRTSTAYNSRSLAVRFLVKRAAGREL